MTYVTMESNVDGAVIIGEWHTRTAAVAQAQRRQHKANRHGNPYGSQFSVRRTYDHNIHRWDCVYRVGGKAVA